MAKLETEIKQGTSQEVITMYIKKIDILLVFLLVVGTLPHAAQNVTNVDFWQEGTNVKISYELDKEADVNVSMSTDGGKTFSSPLKQVTGGIGKDVTPGKNTIVWDVLKEYDKLVGENICFRVNAENSTASYTFNVRGVEFCIRRVDGGKFVIGSNPKLNNTKRVPQVTLSNYYIGESEVTQELWQAVMGSNPSYNIGSTKPVENISWGDCKMFINKLDSITGQTFRLPTEAEWEFAARGGNKSNGFLYSGSDDIFEVAYFRDKSLDYESGIFASKSVKSKKSNELGLYDMTGNVAEMCNDIYGPYAKESVINPKGAIKGKKHVVRGGSFNDKKKKCYTISRNKFSDNPDKSIGFRLAVTKPRVGTLKILYGAAKNETDKPLYEEPLVDPHAEPFEKATLSLNGIDYGHVRPRIDNILIGTYQLKITRSNGKSIEHKITIGEDIETEVDFFSGYQYTVIEQQPQFNGNINQWLASNLKYPPVAAENGIEGRVIVQFVVGKDGSIHSAQVVRGVDSALDKEALRVVNSMPKWVPGKQNGQSVNCKFTMPVVFRLQ